MSPHLLSHSSRLKRTKTSPQYMSTAQLVEVQELALTRPAGWPAGPALGLDGAASTGWLCGRSRAGQRPTWVHRSSGAAGRRGLFGDGVLLGDPGFCMDPRAWTFRVLTLSRGVGVYTCGTGAVVRLPEFVAMMTGESFKLVQ
ncbi:uncharacterized protein isoform X2 [Castor canadensis]|uniref:Uncharacterized protein isoform X2 n=1 Tax=Castor canadensis TaxID=51338 RepID=A0AC58N7N6_CASCN